MELGLLRITRSGQLPFIIDVKCPGFQLLVRVLSSSKDQLGYQPALLPNIPVLGQYPLSGTWQPICQGSAADNRSYVYLVEPAAGQTGAQGEEVCVVKLNVSPQEVWRQHRPAINGPQPRQQVAAGQQLAMAPQNVSVSALPCVWIVWAHGQCAMQSEGYLEGHGPG